MSGGVEEAIVPGSTIVLDSSAVLAYLDSREPTSGVAAIVIDGMVRSGRNRGLVSAVTVTEALVRPFRVSQSTQPGGAGSAIGTVEDFLQHFANVSVAVVDYAIAREAAHVRALTGLRTADALILATAVVSGASCVVGNDERWRPATENLGIALCLLGDYVT